MINILQNGLDLLGFHPACPPDVYFGDKIYPPRQPDIIKKFQMNYHGLL
jgi:hypothetical protein